MNASKKIMITVTDSSNKFKLNKVRQEKYNANKILISSVSEGIKNYFKGFDIYDYCISLIFKIHENEVENIVRHRMSINSLKHSFESYGWETNLINIDNPLILKVSGYNNENFNLSQSIKSFYVEAQHSIIWLQNKLDEYSYDEGFEDSEITVNLVIYDDTYNAAVVYLASLYPHVNFNIITVKDRFRYLASSLGEAVKFSMFDINTILKFADPFDEAQQLIEEIAS